MFKKIDIYIIKKYLSTFLFTIAMITMVAIAIDFFEKVDKLMSDKVTLKQVIFEYYLHFVPWINGLLWPLFAFIAVIFFSSRMAANSEIISILSSGVSYRRLMRPFLIGGIIIASVLWYTKNYVIPHSTKIKSEFESEYIRRSDKKTLSDNTHLFLNKNEKAYIRYFREADSTANNFILERYNDEGKMEHLLKVRKLVYKEDPNIWTMNNYEYHTFHNDKEYIYNYPKAKKDTTINISPEDFIRYEFQMQMLSTPELKEFIAREEDRGIDTALKYKTELYQRTADPFTIIILTILGVAIASRKVRGGLGLHLALGVVLGAGFVILSKFSTTFSTNLSMPPALGAWMPNIIFGIVTIYFYSRAQK